MASFAFEWSFRLPDGAGEVVYVCPFVIPDEVYAGWSAKDKGAEAEQAWNEKFSAYQNAHPELA